MPWDIPAVIPLPDDFIGFDPVSSLPVEGFTSYERYLPHWRMPGACYFTTFRLRDSIPAVVMDEMKRELREWKVRMARIAVSHGGSLPPDEAGAWAEFQRARMHRLQALLDVGHGECLLREARHRRAVEDALRYFEGQRCEMLAFVVMPNHAHALCRPLAGHWLEDLCGSWKWFSARSIHETLGRTGALWQDESFDRIIRDARHYETTVRYIAKNPLKARLGEDEAAVWFCEAIRKANGWME